MEEPIPLPARQTFLATLADRAEAAQEVAPVAPGRRAKASEGAIKFHGLEPTPLAVVVAQGSRVKIAKGECIP